MAYEINLYSDCRRCVDGVAQVFDEEGNLVEENPCKWCNGQGRFLVGRIIGMPMDEIIDSMSSISDRVNDIHDIVKKIKKKVDDL